MVVMSSLQSVSTHLCLTKFRCVLQQPTANLESGRKLRLSFYRKMTLDLTIEVLYNKL
jgi:hypothetical protein